jgi:hypothetical protein
MRILNEIDISRPPKAVFPWIADPRKAMQWQGDVEGGRIITSTPEIVGTTFTESVQDESGRLEMHGTITEYDKNRAMGFHLESRIHEFDVRYTLAQAGNSTRVSIEALIRWKFPMNILSRVMGKKIAESLGRKTDEELHELKRLCEEGETARSDGAG